MGVGPDSRSPPRDPPLPVPSPLVLLRPLDSWLWVLRLAEAEGREDLLSEDSPGTRAPRWGPSCSRASWSSLKEVRCCSGCSGRESSSSASSQAVSLHHTWPVVVACAMRAALRVSEEACSSQVCVVLHLPSLKLRVPCWSVGCSPCWQPGSAPSPGHRLQRDDASTQHDAKVVQCAICDAEATS